MEQQRNNTFRIVSMMIIGLLLLLCGYLVWDKSQSSKIISNQTTELASTEKEKAEFEKNYYETLSDLESMKGDNMKLNAKIDSQKVVLQQQHGKIMKLIGSNADNKKIRDEIAKMKAAAAAFRSEIAALKEENEKLIASNQQLNTEKSLITDQVNQERAYNDELASKNADLEHQRNKIEEEKANLAKKVDKASVIKVTDILVEGYKLSDKGKQVSKRYAKNINGVRVCFKTSQNDLIDAGREKFYVRIINPNGETVNIPSAGSGLTSSETDGEQIPYSFEKDITYENAAAVTCANWQPQFNFSAGSYQIQVYNKGYLAGKSTFTLK